MNNSTLIPFDHTYILYDPANLLSLPLSLFSLFPIFILIFLFSWFLITRELESCIIALGQVINDIISCCFKLIVKFERPMNGQVFKEDGGLVYGMPSSHSQFMAFWSVYTILMVFYKWPYPINYRIKIGYLLLALSLLTGVAISRVFFEYHNCNQIIVGLLTGSVLGCFYFILVSLIRDYGIFDYILKWPIFEILNVKDSFYREGYPSLKLERKEWEKKVY